MKNELLFTPEGVRDVYGKECEDRNFITREVGEVFRSFGFGEIQPPTLEFFNVFNQERGTADTTEMYKLYDQYNHTLVLRPDMTPSLARFFAKNYSEENMPVRLFYTGNTFHYRRGYQGKAAEITQLGAELMNDGSSDADAEMIVMTLRTLKKLSLKDFKIDIGHVEFIHGLMEESGFDQEEEEEYRKLLANKNLFGVEEMVNHKELSRELKELLIQLPDLFGGKETLAFARERVNNQRSVDALQRLETLYDILNMYHCEDYITFDLSMMARFHYYTGTIFKAYTYGTGEAIATGGRYDHLIRQFGKDAPAVGVAIVMDALLDALKTQSIHFHREPQGALILYHSKDREMAVKRGQEYREQGEAAILMRYDENLSKDEYETYLKMSNLKRMEIIHDGEIDVKEPE